MSVLSLAVLITLGVLVTHSTGLVLVERATESPNPKTNNETMGEDHTRAFHQVSPTEEAVTVVEMSHREPNQTLVKGECNDTSQSTRLVSRRGRPFVYLVCYGVLITVGITSNILILLVLSTLRESLMYIYLKSLAVCDLLFCGSIASSFPLLIAGYFNYSWYNYIHTYFWVPVMHVCPTTSLYLIIVIAADRLLHILLPLKAKVVVTRCRARLLVVSVLMAVLASKVPWFFMYQTYQGYVKPSLMGYWYSWSPLMLSQLGRQFLFITTILSEYIPLVLLIIINPTIIIALKRHRKKRAMYFKSSAIEMKDQKKQAGEDRLTVLLIGVCLLSLVCNLPMSITRLVWFQTPSAGQNWKEVANLLFIFDRCANFFVYCITNPEFRIALMCGKRHDHRDSSRLTEMSQRGSSVSDFQGSLDKISRISYKAEGKDKETQSELTQNSGNCFPE